MTTAHERFLDGYDDAVAGRPPASDDEQYMAGYHHRLGQEHDLVGLIDKPGEDGSECCQ